MGVDGVQGFIIHSGAGWGKSFEVQVQRFGTKNSSSKIDAEFSCDMLF